MADPKCNNCAWREKYDRNPSSFLGKLWRWHINWCPGWKTYMNALSQQDKTIIVEKYKYNKNH
jgi:hypothetical protein